MAITRWDPFRELTDIQKAFNRLMSEEFMPRMANGSSLAGPAMEVFDTPEALVVRVELPGVQREDINISVDNRVLTIAGEKKRQHEVKESEYFLAERAYGRFSRSLTLPATVDTSDVTASMKDGVLEVRIAKSPAAKPRQIEIQAEE